MVETASALPKRRSFTAIDAWIDWHTRLLTSSGFLMGNSGLSALLLLKGAFAKAPVKLLSARIILGGTYVDEYSLLLQCVHSMRQNVREHVSLQAGRAFWNVLEHCAIEDVDAPVDHSSSFASRFFQKADHPSPGIHLHGSVSCCGLNFPNSHTDPPAMSTMKSNQLAEIDFQEGVTIHHQKLRSILEISLGEFDSP